MLFQNGNVKILPLRLIITAVGIISFIMISSTAPFKGSLNNFFPKKNSFASTSKDFGVNISGAEFGPQGAVGVLNTDYLYPSDINEFNYFSKKGLKLIRLPFFWERVQHQDKGPLSTVDINGLKTTLDAAQNANVKVILDLHNFARYYGTPLTTADAAKLNDVWIKLATQFKNHPALYGYELMNEPHDLPEGSAGWASLAQSAINAIRTVDTNHIIMVPGYSWQNAQFFQDNNPNFPLTDPANNLLYAGHLYFDFDYSGGYTKSYDDSGAYPMIASDRVQQFINWLSSHNVRGILTEYGVPNNDPRWLTVLDNFEKTLYQSDYIQGGVYWSAGPWWGSYPLSLEPIGSYPNYSDQPQMSITQKYPSTNLVSSPSPTSIGL
jgi:endoglucanase